MKDQSFNYKGMPTEVFAAFRRAGQEHVFRFWNEIDENGRIALVRQARSIDLNLVRELATGRGLAPHPDPAAEKGPAPVLALGEEPRFARRAHAMRVGGDLLKAGKVGTFLVAGGQGSRLGFEGPKGCLPAGPLSLKSLFQLHAEKVLALSERHGARMPIYIMTSIANDPATRAFFERHGFFGLRPENVLFIPQKMLPALDAAGKLVLEGTSRLFLSPNGHGGAYEAFKDGGALADAERRGLEHIFYFQVDNPLVRIADPLFLGFHALAGSEMSLKVLRKTGPEEKIGVVALEDEKTKVLEYSDLSPEDAARLDPSGGLLFWAGSIAIHAFSLPFFRRVAAGGITLPFHAARKKVLSVDEGGAPIEIEATKHETFIFDALPFARKSLCVEVERKEEFAPIKNQKGVDSL
ncbi:MAG TPA: UTP--glucose-1-phosphate uridylyltransferase, partial [Planctomycetota bacterium]|nr:UTP--glucose-1-phosphate uridylyltransferase [Planctomycetota bacterium]